MHNSKGAGAELSAALQVVLCALKLCLLLKAAPAPATAPGPDSAPESDAAVVFTRTK